MNNILLYTVYKLPGILLAFTIHGFFQAFTAELLGDLTPRKQDRLTVNPIPHTDPIGLLLFAFMGYGWSSPVHTNPVHFKNRRKGTLLVACSGIVANLVGAFVFALLFRFLPQIHPVMPVVLGYCIEANIVLAVINLLPIPGVLDGSKILFGLLPPKHYFKMMQYEKMIIIILMLLIVTGYLGVILSPMVKSILYMIRIIVGI